MKSIFLLLLIFPFGLSAQLDSIPEPEEDPDDIFLKTIKYDGITLSAQGSYLMLGSGASHAAVGIQLNDYFGGRFFVRNRYLVGSDYFKFSLAELSVLMIRGDLIFNNDNFKTDLFMTMLTGALFMVNDGVGYTFPIGKDLYISPFVSPFELYFTRAPYENFKGHFSASVGAELKKTMDLKGLQVIFSASGEGFYEYNSDGLGYRLNFSIGVPFACW